MRRIRRPAKPTALQSPRGGQPVLTPEVKQKIADEVKDQLALENQEAQQNAQPTRTWTPVPAGLRAC